MWVYIFAVLSFFSQLSAEIQLKDKKKLNIILILADDLGYETIRERRQRLATFLRKQVMPLVLLTSGSLGRRKILLNTLGLINHCSEDVSIASNKRMLFYIPASSRRCAISAF